MLILRFVLVCFGCSFGTDMMPTDRWNTSDNTYIYAFCLHWHVHPSVCLCSFSVYNVRAYVYVRLNV